MSLHRISRAFLAVCLLAGATARAQDSVPPAPLAPPPPTAPRAAATPEALIGKSVRDLSHGDVGAAVHDDVKALRRGPLLIHGNYCGLGNRPGKPPIDALDAACMRHDSCTTDGKLPNCACDDRLRVEASAIAHDPSEPPDIQALAAATASAMVVLVCKE